MADLLTHVAVGHILKRLSPQPSHPVLFALGNAAPDLIGRAPGLALYGLETVLKQDMPYSITLGFDAFHMPVSYTLSCLLLAWLLPRAWRRVVFLNLLLGGYLHFVVDLMQTHMDGGYRLFFPFSWVDFELGWIGSEDSLYLALPLTLLAGLVELRFRRKGRRGGQALDRADTPDRDNTSEKGQDEAQVRGQV